MTHKEAIAAFYRELCDGKKGTKDYEHQAVARLGTILQEFRRDNESFPGPVQDPWEFFSAYAELKWFPRHKKTFKKLSDNLLVGKIDMEFKVFLEREQKKTRPVVDPRKMPEPESDLSVFDLRPRREEKEVKTRRGPDGNWTIDEQRPDHQLDKTILGFRTPTDEEKAEDRREMKTELQILQRVLRRLNSGWMKDDPVCQALRQHFITQIDHEDDAEQKLEDAWRARDAFKVIEKAGQKKPSKK